MADTRITSDNATALVKIVTWLLLSFTSLAIIGRLAVKLLALRNITADDWLLLAGFVSSNNTRALKAPTHAYDRVSTLQNPSPRPLLQRTV